MIKIDFSVECPKCGKTDRTIVISYGEVSGDHIETCSACREKYVITWVMFVDSVVSELGAVSPPVKCASTLEEYTEEDDDAAWQENYEGEA